MHLPPNERTNEKMNVENTCKNSENGPTLQYALLLRTKFIYTSMSKRNRKKSCENKIIRLSLIIAILSCKELAFLTSGLRMLGISRQFSEFQHIFSFSTGSHPSSLLSAHARCVVLREGRPSRFVPSRPKPLKLAD